MNAHFARLTYFILYIPITLFIPYIIQVLFHPSWVVVISSIIFAIWIGLTMASNSVKQDQILALLTKQIVDGGVQ